MKSAITPIGAISFTSVFVILVGASAFLISTSGIALVWAGERLKPHRHTLAVAQAGSVVGNGDTWQFVKRDNNSPISVFFRNLEC